MHKNGFDATEENIIKSLKDNVLGSNRWLKNL